MDTGPKCVLRKKRRNLLLALLLASCKVSVHGVAVEGVVGDSVVLPCSVGRNQNDVYWRDENSRTVYDIISGKVDLYDQHVRYKGRVHAFPSEFSKGNYSIRLSAVKSVDAGSYSCHVPNADTHNVELKVKEKGDPGEEKTDASSGDVMRRAGGMSPLLPVCVLLCGFAV